MRRPIVSGELLDLADLLADLDGPTPAHTTSLRRAISSAYYALYHELITRAAERTIGADPARHADRHSLSRWYAHADVRTVSQWIVLASAGDTPRSKRVAAMLTLPPADLVAVASAFLALQDARHEADYDYDADITVQDTRRYITLARNAINRLPTLVGDRVYDNYLMFLLSGPRFATR